MYFIFWYDYVALPIYLMILGGLLLTYFHRKHRHEPELKKYFTRGMVLKFIGGIAIGLIYEHYYRGAYDGRWYFEGANVLNTYFSRHPGEVFRVFFNSIGDFNNTNLDGLNMSNYFLFANESFFVAKIGALFNYGAFHMFLPLSLIFCFFAYIALWNFFVFIQREFGIRTQLAAFCTIFIPSVLVWDSSIFKDTVTFSSMCWLFITGYYAFVRPRKVLQNIAGFALAAYLIISVKVYIFAAFVPFFLLFIFNSYKDRIRNDAVRVLATPFIFVIAGAAILVFLRNADELLGRYSVENALDTAANTYNNITMYGGSAGSAYDLNVDFSSPLGILAAIPVGINLTLFRPYPWEYAKIFIFFSSIESMLVLYFTVMLFFKGGLGSTFKIIARTPVLQFCVMFTGLFAFMTGIAAANFGTLVRYKIPCLPFYFLFLVYLYQVKVAEARERDAAKLRALHDQESEDIPVHSS
ncbi:hypothetical protein [Flaviaesturariibacter aridisoli]|uniref:Glycosyltransferase RgtA/B/C/D-like domain-containing protein n=1 Tax=Flaviaesturariibacter aridisoli TaxID=2545761 RepID=A0A4R4E2L8_9BACT|nr:hypothetical protein [Flaviaesturariibacter aridisoli]TCZ73137.1 hypothetical protein E0486_07225 [Flaviaesturariibacter aridisoli]